MDIRTAVLAMLDAWEAAHDSDMGVHCVRLDSADESAIESTRLLGKLDGCRTIKDVQDWVTDADELGLWADDNGFEAAYCKMVDIAESDPSYVRPDVSV